MEPNLPLPPRTITSQVPSRTVPPSSWVFVLLGIYVIITGCSALFSANALRALGVEHSGGAVVAAVLTIVLGVLVLVSPFATAGLTMMICGGSLVYTGVVTIISGLGMFSDEAALALGDLGDVTDA